MCPWTRRCRYATSRSSLDTAVLRQPSSASKVQDDLCVNVKWCAGEPFRLPDDRGASHWFGVSAIVKKTWFGTGVQVIAGSVLMALRAPGREANKWLSNRDRPPYDKQMPAASGRFPQAKL